MTTPCAYASACARSQHLVRRVRDGGHRHRRRERGVEVLRHLARAQRHRLLDGARARLAVRGLARRLQCLELHHRRPLRIDGQPAAVGQAQSELHHLAAHAVVGDQHPRRQLREVLAQHVLARAPLGRPARQHGGEPSHDLAVLVVGAAPLLLADLQLFERAARALEAGADLLGRGVPAGGAVRDPAQLRRLRLQLPLDARHGHGVGRPAPRRGPAGRRDRRPDADTGGEGQQRETDLRAHGASCPKGSGATLASRL